MSDHAILSPSSADRWLTCRGSVILEKNMPDVESEYAKEGTNAHSYASWLLEQPELEFGWPTGYQGEWSPDMHDNIEPYYFAIKEQAKGHTLLVEQRLPIGHVTLERDAHGTGDAIVIHADGNIIEINDFKYGMGVKVYAKKNRQMMLYALGAIHQFEAFGDFKKIVLRIHQPRLNHLDDWDCTREELEDFAAEVKLKAYFIWCLMRGEVEFNPEQDLVPTEKGCMFCKAKASCPALIKHAFTTISEDFVDLDKNLPAVVDKAVVNVDKLDNKKLSLIMQQAGLIEDFIKAIRARVETELFAGREVPGFKLVEGKKGNRKWEDEAVAEQEMKDLGVPPDLIYTKEVISVSKAEKLLKKDKKVWVKLHDLITQSDGKPSVAPSTDPRPALKIGAAEDDFEMLEDKV